MSTPTKSNWFKILLFIVLGLLIVSGSIFVGTQIGRNQVSNPQPNRTQPTSTEQKETSTFSRRSEDVENIKKMCRNKQYQNLALQSLKDVNGKFSLITSKDLEKPDPLLSYLEKTKNLCELLISNIELEISEETNGIWNYRFIIKPFPGGISQGYGLLFFDNQYRFILPRSHYL